MYSGDEKHQKRNHSNIWKLQMIEYILKVMKENEVFDYSISYILIHPVHHWDKESETSSFHPMSW